MWEVHYNRTYDVKSRPLNFKNVRDAENAVIKDCCRQNKTQ